MTTLTSYSMQLDTVKGWLTPTDASAFGWADAIQRRRGVGGDVLEIGVYYGKSAIALGCLVRPGERLVLCDIFELNPKPGYRGPSLDGFLTTFSRFHDWPPTVHHCPSTELLGHEHERRFRLVHVDGSHSYPVVKHDIETTVALLVEGGVVVFDDYRTQHRPGVAAAVWDELVNGRLRPFAVTPWKLYATWAADARDYADAFMAECTAAGIDAIRNDLLDVDVVVVRPSAARISGIARVARAVVPPAALGASKRLRAKLRAPSIERRG